MNLWVFVLGTKICLQPSRVTTPAFITLAGPDHRCWAGCSAGSSGWPAGSRPPCARGSGSSGPCPGRPSGGPSFRPRRTCCGASAAELRRWILLVNRRHPGWTIGVAGPGLCLLNFLCVLGQSLIALSRFLREEPLSATNSLSKWVFLLAHSRSFSISDDIFCLFWLFGWTYQLYSYQWWEGAWSALTYRAALLEIFVHT